MRYLHYEVEADAGGVVRIELDKQANVRLMDDANYAAYRGGHRHRYYGGLAKRSPVTLAVPHAGRWHVVVDLGGSPGRVSAAVSLVA